MTSWFSNKRNRTDTTNSKREKLALLQQLRLLQDQCGRTRVGAVADSNGAGGVMADGSVPAPRPSAASDGTGVDANGQSIHSLQLFGVGPVGHSVALAGGNQYDVAMPCQPVIYETTAGEVRAVGAGAHQRSSLMDSIFDCPQPQLPDWNGPGPSVYRSPAIDFPYCEQYFGSGYESLLQMPSNSNEPFGLFESNLTFSQPSFSPPSPPAAAQMPLVQRTYPYYGNEAIARVAGSGQSVGQQTTLQPAYASRMSLPTISFCGIQSPGNGVGSGHWNRTASNIVSSVEEQQKYGQCVSADYPSVCVAARDRHELYQ